MKIEERRATRGVRMATLIGEEAEADEQFWGQGAWKEEGSEVDNDFSESESGRYNIYICILLHIYIYIVWKVY